MGLWDGLKPNEIGDAPSAPDSYTNNQWQAQSALYREMWEYFNRDIFDTTLSAQSNIKKYPLGINIFEQACTIHRAALVGEFKDDVLQFRVTSPNSKNKDAAMVEQKIDQIWVESGRNSILLEGGLVCQILGGVVFRVLWNPARKKAYIRLLQPDAWFPVWDPDDYHQINECYVSYMIDAASAKHKYNVRLDDDKDVPVPVWEHWDRDFYEVRVDGKLAYWDRAHQFPMGGENIYRDPQTNVGVIPFEYFPRDRAGSFYGIPLGKNLLQLQNEYNLRAADLGDGAMEAAHQYMFAKNIPAGTDSIRLQRGKLINLGVGALGGKDPDVIAVKGGEVPEASVNWVQRLQGDTRSAAYTPDVAYGEDEGSQRSALTLAFRMWPMTQSVRAVRGFWTDSFYHLNRKAIIVASSYEKNGYGLESRHADYRLIPMWAPMLPKDRSEEVNEVVVRKQTGLISTYHAVELLEDREKDYIEEEVARIEADRQQEADLMMQQAMAQGQGGNPAKTNITPPRSVPDS